MNVRNKRYVLFQNVTSWGFSAGGSNPARCQTVRFIFRQLLKLARSAKMVAMADNNEREKETKAGYSAHKSRGRPIPRLHYC